MTPGRHVLQLMGLVLAFSATAIGCGDGADSASTSAATAGPTSTGAPTEPAPPTAPATTAAPTEDDPITQAEAQVAAEDYDGAIATLEEAKGDPAAEARLEEIRIEAAEATLASAKRKLREAPQAAVAQTRTSLKYHATDEAREFLEVARKALRKFQAEQRALGNP